MQPAIEDCLHRRVRVCVFAQEIDAKDTQANQTREQSIAILRSLGAHVTIRPGPHFKLVVIDEEILWDGSLNMLSYRNTEERMTRWFSRAKVIEATKRHKLDQCQACTSRPSRLIDVLIRRRQYLGLSQADLAKRTGVDQSTLSKLEAGKTDVKLSTLQRLIKELGMQICATPRYAVPLVDDLFDRSLNKNHWFERDYGD